jgi:hypothetical protein
MSKDTLKPVSMRFVEVLLEHSGTWKGAVKLITNQLLYQLSYTGITTSAGGE